MNTQTQEKAKNIKLLLMDVDGVLTDGTVSITENCQESRSFSMLDGLGIRLAQSAGLKTGLISGRKSDQVLYRANQLDIDFIQLGFTQKLPIFNAACKQFGLDQEQVAFIGDDFIDLPILTRCGLSISVANAHPIVKKHTDFTTTELGGFGAVREAIEFILEAQNKLSNIVQNYLDQGDLLENAQ